MSLPFFFFSCIYFSMKLKRYRKRKIGDYFSRGLVLIVISLICSLIVINYFAKRVDKIIIPMAESKTRKFVTEIINNATLGVDFSDDLISIDKNDNDEIKMINYNSYEVIKLLDTITGNIQMAIDELELGSYRGREGYVIEEIPFGAIFDNAFLRNVGPKIKLKLSMYSSVVSNIETEVKPYGLNNAYVEMRVFLEVTGRIDLPFVSEEIKVNNVIPISMNIVQGTVPEAYISSYK